MAIGVRISSTNLSGKTATVNFVPITGYTSGSTQNLGSLTVPFNNISYYPYGEYSLYFSEYDHTYVINVLPDKGVNQSFVFTSRITGVTSNHSIGLLDFNDLSADIIDLGVQYSNWNLIDLYPTTEKGYMFVFENVGDSNIKQVIFINYKGDTLLQYTGSTTSYNYDVLDGNVVYYSLNDLGVLLYSDGISGFTYNWNYGTGVTEFDTFDIEWNDNGSNVYGQFVISLYNSVSNDKYFYLLDCGVSTLLTTGNTLTSDIFFSYQSDSNFFMCHTKNSSGIYQNLKIYDGLGSLVRTITFSDSYTDTTYSNFGKNQFGGVFYNNSNFNIDYYIVRYNGNTDTLTTTTHVRGINYQNITQYSTNGADIFEYDKSAWVVALFKQVDDNPFVGTVMTYCDFIYTLNNNETIYTDVYQDSGLSDKSLYLSYIYLGSIPFSYGNRGDDNFSVVSFTSNGLVYNSLGPISGFSSSYKNIYRYGDKMVFGLRDSSDVYDMFLYNISSGNTNLDTLQITLTGNPSNFTYHYSYDTFYISNYVGGWVLNSNTTLFTSIGVYQNHDWAVHFDKSFRYDAVIAYDNTCTNVRVIESNSISDNISLPSNNGTFSIKTGEDRFVYVYGDIVDNMLHIELYDFYGNLKNDQKTIYTTIDNLYVSKDRYAVTLYDSSNTNYIIYLVSDDKITSVVMDDFNNYTALNDYSYWIW
jgi:hypothetical protein